VFRILETVRRKCDNKFMHLKERGCETAKLMNGTV